MSRGVKTFIFVLAGVALVLTIGVVRMFQTKHANSPSSTDQRAQAIATNPIAQSPVTNAMKSPSAAGIPANYPDFKLQPQPNNNKNTNKQKTKTNKKNTNVIRQLAHNPLEYARM